MTCPNSPPLDSFKPVVFWTFTQSSQSAQPVFSLVYCTPTIKLFYAAVEVALQSGDLQNATIISNFTQPNNITDPNGPLSGQVLNGVVFNLSNADLWACLICVLLFFRHTLCRFAQQRAQAATTGLTEAIVQKAITSPGGLPNQIRTFGMINITETIYVRLYSLFSCYVKHSDTATWSAFISVSCCQGDLLRTQYYHYDSRC